MQFALAVCGRPELLFLDEPTVGMDIEARQQLWVVIHRMLAEGCSVLLTTHYLEEAEALADRVCVMARGQVIHQGTVEELRACVASKRIRCTATVPLDTVCGWPEVSAARRNQGRLEVTTAETEAVVRRLLAADPDLGELEVCRAGLAEAFTEITRLAAGAAQSSRREAA